jgi:hypothetical protein
MQKLQNIVPLNQKQQMTNWEAFDS